MVRTELRVLYGDTDCGRVVYYATYLRWFEAGRAELIRARGITYREVEERFGVLLPVTEAHAEYRAPARYDDLVTVETRVGEVRRASARFDYRILRGDELLVTGHTVHACVDQGGRVQRLPAELAQRLGPGEPA
jgi:acyl-CoA thioester hydrolase